LEESLCGSTPSEQKNPRARPHIYGRSLADDPPAARMRKDTRYKYNGGIMLAEELCPTLSIVDYKLKG